MINVTFVKPLTGIREARLSDLPEMVDIYNSAIALGGITCDTERFTTEERMDWFELHQLERYPLFVYEVDGKVAGYSHLTGYRTGRKAVEHVAEISYYVSGDFRKQGIGSKLVNHTLNKAKEIGYENVIAFVVEGNAASEAMLHKYGFREWGRMPKIANFNGVLHDHIYFGLNLKTAIEI